MDKAEGSILALAQALTAAAGPADMLARLATEARGALGAEWIAVWTHQRRKKTWGMELSVPAGSCAPAPRRAGRKGDLLAEALKRREPIVRRIEAIDPAALQHLAEAPPVIQEIAVVPFTMDADRTGVLEIAWAASLPPDQHLARTRYLAACSSLASSALASMVRAEAGRQQQLAAINRLMQLYDVAQAFHSSLEQEALLPIIGNRIGMMLEAAVVRVWLRAEGEEDRIACVFPPAEGEAETLAAGGGFPWTVYEAGEAAVAGEGDLDAGEDAAGEDEIGDAAPPADGGDGAVAEDGGGDGQAMAVPLTVDDSRLGVLEVIRDPDAPPFGRDDLDFLEELSRQAAIALRNASLLAAERRAHQLGALLDISREITSTLDLDRVLAAIVNHADSIVPNDRCAILLGDRGRPELRAVSGQTEVNRKEAGTRELEDILAWTFLGGQGIYISELDGEIEADREETREKFRRHFETSGMKSYVAFALKDEEGPLGTLSLESQQPYFVSEEKLEALTMLANQATVAIRNASLYRQIPLLNVMEPLAGWQKRIRRIPGRRWLAATVGVAAAAAILVFVPWNMKVAGPVVVLPHRNWSVTTEVEGIVDAVYRREGDRVRKGDLIATILERDYRVRVEEVRSRYEIAGQEVARHEAGLDRAAARQARIRRDELGEELGLLRRELARTRIEAPSDGTILTPRLETRAGTFLDRGEVFCALADMQDAAVEVRIPEAEIGEISEGQRIRLKINAFPTITYHGRVEIVGQKVVEEAAGRFLIVRGRVEGNDLPLKTGMLGRAKVEVGPRSVGYVLFRRPARFLWRVLWGLLP